ncbi:MAG: DUF86 domain-containing protein [Bacteroides sp.]|nr:DUF86 domain-containing protein [Ruminococcus flavefaciens]MCM1555061.1 DUF86 domain-containing protein [Bacteroides sp.]MCM1555488.1 DUF86 domain-containing protein [Bacteroides sp.]
MSNKARVLDLLDYVLDKISFVEKSTLQILSFEDFGKDMLGMITFNSTCMCLQTIGETLRQMDRHTEGKLLSQYTSIPWKTIFAFRNIVSHEYAMTDPQEVFFILKNDLQPLKDQVEIIRQNILDGGQKNLF